MKRNVILFFVMCLAGLVATAQTDFRHLTFEEALAVAKKEKKLVFIDFYTDWCGPCKKMATQVFPTKEVGDYMNKKFVNIKLNAEKEGEELAKKFEVNAYPTFIITDATGAKIGTVMGYMEGDAFINKVSAATDPTQSPEKVKARYEAGERTPALVNAYAMQFMEARKEKEGFAIIDEYFNSLSDKERLKADNAFLFTRYTVELGNDRADFMVANRDKFDKSVRESILNRIDALYHSELARYFSGYMYREKKYNDEEYAALKKEIKEIGLDKNYNYDIMFSFIEKRLSAANDAEYLTFIEGNYEQLEPREKDLLVFNLTRLLNSEDPDMRQGISKFLRSRLATMSPTSISFAARTLGNVEATTDK